MLGQSQHSPNGTLILRQRFANDWPRVRVFVLPTGFPGE